MDQLRYMLVGAALVTMALVGCGDLDRTAFGEGLGTVEGQVDDGEGPAEGVWVYALGTPGGAVKTNAEGEYTLHEVPSGSRTIQAITDYGAVGSVEARVYAGQTVHADIVLTDPASILGTVLLEGETAHGGSAVFLSGTPLVVTTTEEGAFAIPWVPPGCYTVSAEHEGFVGASVPKICVAVAGSTTVAPLVLASLDGCEGDAECGEGRTCQGGTCVYDPGCTDETCNGIDDDCDGLVDEGQAAPCGVDMGICTGGVSFCVNGEHASDCFGAVMPTAEDCTNGLDDDCDGATDTHDDDCTYPKLDILVVMDNSNNTCSLQNAIAEELGRFFDVFSQNSSVDPRLAVINTDPFEHLASNGEQYNIPGAFLAWPTSEFYYPCNLYTSKECSSDADCLSTVGGDDDVGAWACWGPDSTELFVNFNGTVNTSCRRSCEADAECKSVFGEPFECNYPGEEIISGCFDPPATSMCFGPDGERLPLPEVLSLATMDRIPCLVTIGIDGSAEANLESGLGNALTALSGVGEDLCESDNPNLCNLLPYQTIVGARVETQALYTEVSDALAGDPDNGPLLSTQGDLVECLDKLDACLEPCAGDKTGLCPGGFIAPGEPNFLRPEAELVIIFVSNTEDCSVAEGKEIKTNDYRKCRLLGAVDEFPLEPPAEFLTFGYSQKHWHPLEAVKTFVNGFKSLKSDPSKVHVAALIGSPVTGGTTSCVVPDQCTVDRAVEACACYTADPPVEGCPSLLAQGQDEYCLPGFDGSTGCFVQPTPGCQEALEEELAYRVACIDACFSDEPYGPGQHCSDQVPEACGCYAAAMVDTAECSDAFVDEPTYRKACQQACFAAAKEAMLMVPKAYAYLCHGPFGQADPGPRYEELVSSFGPNGHLLSVCSPDGLGDQLETLVFDIIGYAPPETCGDGACSHESLETCSTCPTDCGACVECGAGHCESYEACVDGACLVKGSLGTPCTNGDDCIHELCVVTDEGTKVCTIECSGACPSDWECVPEPSGGGTSVCVPAGGD